MKSEWKKCKIGDVSLLNSNTYSLQDNWDYVNYLDTGNITANSINEIQHIDLRKSKLPSRARRKVNYRSIIYSTVRPNQLHYGFIEKMPSNFLVSTGFTVIDADEKKCNVKFLYYFLVQDDITKNLHAIAEQAVSTYPSIKAEDIENLEITLPPLPTQKKIAAILSALDAKIENNNAINRNLEQQAQALFKSWFVDFEPFGGKMPEGWRVGRLEDFCNVFTGKKNANAANNGENMFFTCAPEPLKISTYIYDGAAIIVAGNGAYVGRTSFYEGKFDLYQRTYACTVKDSISQSYIYVFYWLVKYVMEMVNTKVHGSAIPYLVYDDIAKIFVPFDKNIYDDICPLFKSIMGLYLKNIQENSRLAALRDTLLPKLMSGEIEV